MRRYRLLVSFLVFAVPLASSLGAESKFEKKFPVSPGGTLTVNTDAGSVDVTGGSGNEVVVVATVRGREGEVKGFEITADASSGGVEVRGKMERHSWGHNDLDVQFKIAVPRKYSADIKTAGGNVSVRSLEGTVGGATSGGNVEMNDVAGPVRFETSGGNIHVQKVQGDLTMETSGGNIDVSAVTGTVRVHTSGGNVRVTDINGKVDAGTSGGDIQVQVNNENKGIVAKTSGGDVEVIVPGNVGATIDASTSGGSIECDLPLTTTGKISEERVRGTVNGGGPEIQARTSGGSIRITSR